MSGHPELEHLAASMPVFEPATDRSQSRMSISHTKGLLNKPGQNNCFLNSAVQVLWHLDVFRRSFRELSGHACLGDACIFCALKSLFDQFQSSNESVIPPDALRLALSNTFCDQRRFQMGFMDDACECFENILLRIHYHLTNMQMDHTFTKCQAHCISHQKFGMNLTEQIVCNHCGAQSEELRFWQIIHYASTSALCNQARQIHATGGYTFGNLLKLISSVGDVRNCPRMCGKKIKIKKSLVNRPEIISIGLVWDSDHAAQTNIENMFNVIETRIKLEEVFDLEDKGEEGEVELQLVGLVTYYGKHYSTYLYNTRLGKWIYVDDANVVVIGPHWSQVVSKSIKNHFQPLLLLYANPNGTAVTSKTALKQIVPMTVNNHKKHHEQKQLDEEQQNVRNERLARPKEVSGKYYLDMVDSPCTNSSTSDIGELNNGYISRKTVENVIKMQKCAKIKQAPELAERRAALCQNRSSFSSIDSFDVSLAKRNHIGLCSLQRRDSGNSSGERASSVSSSETPPGYIYRSHSLKAPLHGKHCSSKSTSDQGYDSFSISSADSYPITSNNVKMNQKLKQIPEDVLDGIDAMSLNSLHNDQLASEVDCLLKKSYEMEKEGDLLAAATLSDSAATKARQAMDMPYSNHQLLISANMKYSMCVMRCTRLHKRLLEREAEEKRALKAQEHHHSRQSSRDSTHARHSRQNSRDSKDAKANLEMYATLPKKNSGSKTKKTLQASLSNVSDHPIYSNLETIRGQTKKTRKEMMKDSDFSDYYSEWDGLGKQDKHHKPGNVASGWQSETCGEMNIANHNKKQCKVKRKLMFGNLLKNKNKSLPDLREDALDDKSVSSEAKDTSLSSCSSSNGSSAARPTIVANIHSKGFHQRGGFMPKPSLLKVAPPHIQDSNVKSNNPASRIERSQSIESRRSLAPPPPTPPKKSTLSHAKVVQDLKTNNEQNAFFRELNQKRLELQKIRAERMARSLMPPPAVESVSNVSKKPSSHEIANFITRCSTNQSNSALMNERVKQIVSSMTTRGDKSPTLPSSSSQASPLYSPIPIHAGGASALMGKLNRPPDYETTLKRLNSSCIESNKAPSQQTNQKAQSNAKKSVKFSDTVEMVASADADEEDLISFLANPLLKKVLANRTLPRTF